MVCLLLAGRNPKPVWRHKRDRQSAGAQPFGARQSVAPAANAGQATDYRLAAIGDQDLACDVARAIRDEEKDALGNLVDSAPAPERYLLAHICLDLLSSSHLRDERLVEWRVDPTGAQRVHRVLGGRVCDHLAVVEHAELDKVLRITPRPVAFMAGKPMRR
jgi:hypothetical protein